MELKFKVEIGQIFKDDKRNLIITDREYRIREMKSSKKPGGVCKVKERWYKYKCKKCSWEEGWVTEYSLLKNKSGCSCCCKFPRVAVLGINTIWDKARFMVSLGVNEFDAKNNTPQSNKDIKVKCPHCNNEKNIKISNIYKNKSIGCVCGDGFSYSEKFMISVLKQLNIEYRTQLNKCTFKWIGKYRYDFYIPKYNMIIETHGEQHYIKGCFDNRLEYIQKNDKLKFELAKKNGIDNYIILDCKESNLNYIKKSILNSELNNILNLSKVDWNRCEEFTISNLVKKVSKYWNNKKDSETTTDVAEVFGISVNSVRRYLEKGNTLNYCKYCGSEEKIKNTESKSKKVAIYKNGNCIGVFESIRDLSRESEKIFNTKFSRSCISYVCSGKQKHHKGFTFKYVEENQTNKAN